MSDSPNSSNYSNQEPVYKTNISTPAQINTPRFFGGTSKASLTSSVIGSTYSSTSLQMCPVVVSRYYNPYNYNYYTQARQS